MRKITDKEKDIANFLNSKRNKAFIDIYEEKEFSGLGILIDEDLKVYKYLWEMRFNKKNNSFAIVNEMYEFENRMIYEKIESFLLKDLNIVEKEYTDDSDANIKTMEIIRLKGYVNEFKNRVLFKKIINKINDILKEDL